MPTIKEQEDLMHIIHDIVKIGVSISSLEWLLKNMNERFGITNVKNILNSRMKNERYSENFDYPLSKVVYEDISIIDTHEQFYERKLKVIQLLVANGANLNCLKEKYNYHTNPLSLDDLLEFKTIDKKIYDYLKTIVIDI